MATLQNPQIAYRLQGASDADWTLVEVADGAFPETFTVPVGGIYEVRTLTWSATSSVYVWSPISLFSAGEQGAWFEPGDFTRYMSSLGPELVTNGSFSDGVSGWSPQQQTSTLNVVSGQLEVTCTGSGYGAAVLTAPLSPVVDGVLLSANISLGASIALGDGVIYNKWGTYQSSDSGASKFFSATGAVYLTLLTNTNVTGAKRYFDNVSVRELTAIRTATLFQDAAGTVPVTAVEQPVGLMLDRSGRGNHASQTTATSRPVLSARVNLLTKTEQFDDAVWIKAAGIMGFQGTGSAPIITPNAGIAPNGTLSADRVQLKLNGGTTSSDRSGFYVDIAATIGVPYLSGIFVKPLSAVADQLLLGNNIGILSAGTSAVSATITDVGGGWKFISRALTPTSSIGTFRVQILGHVGPDSLDMLVWGTDLRPANDGVGLPPYQRVNTATDYDTVGFPLYLACDGVDDGMITNPINFSATDKVTVVAGVRKLSSVGTAIIAELSEYSYQTPNTFSLQGQAVGFLFGSRGSAALRQDVMTTPSSYPSNVPSVVSGIGNISGDQSILRVNGAQEPTTVSDQGAGTFGNYPICLFRRGDASYPFNGRFYGMIVRGAQSDATQITAAENYLNAKTKAY